MLEYIGGCHCQNIVLKLEITARQSMGPPRACDCNFCLKHGAAYISDNNGRLFIGVKNVSKLSKYRHGDRIAQFLVCQVCGVLVGVSYRDGDCLYASVNSKAIAQSEDFGTATVVSPQTLSAAEKSQRWQTAWFRDVTIEGASL